MSNRKPYNDRLGYIASRHNLLNGEWAVIYLSEAQGLDPEAGKYAVVCEAHSSIYQTTNLSLARTAMKSPDFCEECMK